MNITYYDVRCFMHFPELIYSKALMSNYSKLVFLDDEKKEEIQVLQEKWVFENFAHIQNLLNSKLQFILKAICNASYNIYALFQIKILILIQPKLITIFD